MMEHTLMHKFRAALVVPTAHFFLLAALAAAKVPAIALRHLRK